MNFLIIFSFICNFNNFLSQIILPFKRNLNFKSNLHKDIIYTLYDNILLTDIDIGSPKSQKISFRIYLTRQSMITLEKFYDSNLSESYSSIPLEKRDYYEIDLYNGTKAKEKFFFNLYDNQKILEVNDFVFINAIKISKTIDYNILGLTIPDFSEIDNIFESNLILQLKKKDIINNYIMTIDYKNDIEGNIVIGKYPYEYNNKSYNEKNYTETNSVFFYSHMMYGLNFYIEYDNKLLYDYPNRIQFILEEGLIKGSYKFLEILENDFFNKSNNNCFRDNFGNLNNLIFWYCNKNVNFKDFKEIKIINKELKYNFILDHKDLFYKSNNGYYYFLMYFIKNDDRWIFGNTFLKKYKFTFNQDSKTIGLAIENKNKNNNNNNINIYLILIIFLIGIILGLIYYIYIILKKFLSKKKKANELNDEYVYELNYNNVKNNNNKLLN